MSTDLVAIVRKSAKLDSQIESLQKKSKRFEADPREQTWQPVFDVYHHGEHMFVDLELPGVPQGTIQVDQEPTAIVVSGEKPSLESVPHREDHVSARNFGNFRTQFALPPGFEVQELDRRMENGVLHLKITLLPQATGTLA